MYSLRINSKVINIILFIDLNRTINTQHYSIIKRKKNEESSERFEELKSDLKKEITYWKSTDLICHKINIWTMFISDIFVFVSQVHFCPVITSH